MKLTVLIPKHRKFFDLPLDTKITCAHKRGPLPVRGYNGYSQEKSWKLSPGNEGLLDAKDARESLDIGPIHDSRYSNPWIAEEVLPTFREHIESYYTIIQETANTILGAIELGLELPPGFLLSRALPDATLGILSLLVQDSEGGLEFEDRANPGTFLPVRNDDRSDLIINVSDMPERWTNGVLKAGLHRVSVPQKVVGDEGDADAMLPDRYSVVFLYRPGEESSVGPMIHFVSKERPALCDEISALGYLERQNRLVYA